MGHWQYPPGIPASRDDLPDRFAAVHVEALAAGDLELARVEAELVQDGRVNVGDVVWILDGVEADLVSRAVLDAALDAAAGEEGAEAVRMVIAASLVAGDLGRGRAADVR